MRKFLFLSALIVGAANLCGCFESLDAAQNDAARLETAFHSQMAQGDFAGIYNNADGRYRQEVTREKSDALFSDISRKLGAPLDCKPEGIQVSGSTIRSRCKTHFAKNATADEAFVWVKSGGQYRLVGYTIHSDELIVR